MKNETTDHETIFELWQSACGLAQLDRHELRPVIRSMIRAIEKIGGPLDNDSIDSWPEFADPLIEKGFVDATPGYYASKL